MSPFPLKTLLEALPKDISMFTDIRKCQAIAALRTCAQCGSYVTKKEKENRHQIGNQQVPLIVFAHLKQGSSFSVFLLIMILHIKTKKLEHMLSLVHSSYK